MTRALTIAFAVVAMLGCQRSEPARERVGSTSPPPVGEPIAKTDVPTSFPGTRKDMTAIVGSATRAAIADLDGDGTREIVLVDAKQVRVVDRAGRELATLPVTRGIQVLVAGDIDGDGRAELFAGWGVTRDHRDTKATITVIRMEGGKLVEEAILTPETTRHDVTAIVPMPDAKAVLIAYFDAKYTVTSVVAKRGARAWEASKIASIRMATSYARGDLDGDGTIDLVVGRMYGDDAGVDGDAFVLAPDGKRTPIPTTRGLRSLAVADTDGDGRAEVFMGDGWHQNYKQSAHGQLTWVRSTNGKLEAGLIEDVAGQYAIERIAIASLEGTPSIVTAGSHHVRVYQRAWRGLTIGGVARDIAVGDVDGVPGDEILIVGDKSELVSLPSSAWR